MRMGLICRQRIGRWTIVLGLPFLSLLAAHCFFTPQFEVNDDIAMNMIAAGVGLAPRCFAHLMFMSPVLGKLLNLLYGSYPSIPWYYFMLQGAQTLAGVAIADAVVMAGAKRARLALLASYFLAVDLPLHVGVQFTQTAALVVNAAVVVWWSRGAARPWTFLSLILFLSLAVTGVMVREYCGILVLLVWAPFLTVDALRLWYNGAISGPVPALVALIAIGLGFASVLVPSAVDSYNPGWREFRVFNRLRAEFTDFRNVDYTPETKWAYDRVGWSRNDFDLLATFFFADPNVYSLKNLRLIAQACPRREFSVQSIRDHLAVFSYAPLLVPLLGAVFLPAGFLIGRFPTTWAHYAAALAGGVITWLLLAGAVHRCPVQVVHSLLGSVATVGLVAVGTASSTPLTVRAWLSRFAAGAAVIAFIVAVFPALDNIRVLSNRTLALDQAIRNHVRELHPRPDQLYAVWGNQFPFEGLLPMHGLGDLRDFKMFGIGCVTTSPIGIARLREFGIDDLVTAIYTRPDVLVICNAKNAHLLATFIREHRHVEATATLVSPPANVVPCFEVYRFEATRPVMETRAATP